ncbi:hypothetical protein [Rhodanobacter sp. BL-MT-08]
MSVNGFGNKAAYAKHRGCSDSLVSRLSEFLVYNAAGLVDFAASDARIAHYRDPARGGKRGAAPASAPAAAAQPVATTRVPPAGAAPSGDAVGGDPAYRNAATRERVAKARLAELELAEKTGELVRKSEVAAAVFGLSRQAMEALDALADRLAPQLAAETDVERVHALITENASKIRKAMLGALPGLAEEHAKAA